MAAMADPAPAGDPRLSVILVNYRTTGLLVDCLRSLRARLGEDSAGVGRLEVIVVDNASGDFDARAVLQAWPEARVVESSTNVGFGQGNNLGAAVATGDYLWLLNTDTLIPEDHHLDALLAFLDAHPNHGAASPLLTDDAGTVQPWQTAYFPSLWRMAAAPPARLAARLPALRRHLSTVDTNLWDREAADVEQVVAASLIVRRTVYEQVGGFSPEYFFFLEDTDLCRKLQAAGWRIRWLPQAHVIHLWGRSVRDPVARQRMFFAAQDVYFRKWHRPWERAALRIMRLPLMAGARWQAAAARLRRR